VSKFVLDTSAFLAVAHVEPGAEKVLPVLRESVISAVNFSEVLQKLIRKGMSLANAEEEVNRFVGGIVPFDEEQASISAGLESVTRPFGLSLGDRACLALGIRLRLPVLTADRDWAKLDIGVSVELIRGNSS
jgi:PIN domain nuclease of toxin-antitoxin system